MSSDRVWFTYIHGWTVTIPRTRRHEPLQMFFSRLQRRKWQSSLLYEKWYLAVCWRSVDPHWTIWSASKRFGFFRTFTKRLRSDTVYRYWSPVPCGYIRRNFVSYPWCFTFIDTGRNKVAVRLLEPLLPSFLPSLLTYELTYLLIYSMGQSPLWETNKFWTSQEILRILWSRKFITAVPIRSQLDPFHTPTSHFLKI
jgi:hypothetical protein